MTEIPFTLDRGDGLENVYDIIEQIWAGLLLIVEDDGKNPDARDAR